MRITRLYLRNYRVYEEPVDLELPAGLVGVYGPNGSGKSALLEAVLWTMWGKARTSKEEIRTSRVGADCETEVEFEHEGHLYVVRRRIVGQSATVRAEAHADGAQVAEGAKDTVRYVHSVLGMSDHAFRASVFAEQGQLASFSANSPSDRRRLVLGLLGVTPLDTARDQARKDARGAKENLEQLRSMMADVKALEAELEEAERKAAAAEASASAALEEHSRLDAALGAAEAEHERLSRLEVTYAELVAAGRAQRQVAEQARERAARAQAELEEIRLAGASLAARAPLVERSVALEGLVRLAADVVKAETALAKVALGPEPPRPDAGAAEEAGTRSKDISNRLHQVEGRVAAVAGELDRARRALADARSLSGESQCPLCGQDLGSSFESVLRHRGAELADVERRSRELEADLTELRDEARAAKSEESAARRELEERRSAWAAYELSASRRSQASEQLDAARSALAGAVEVQRESGLFDLAENRGFLESLGAPDEARLSALSEQVARNRQAERELARLRAQVDRRGTVESQLDEERRIADQAGQEVEALRDKVASLGFRPEHLEAARRARQDARAAADAASGEARRLGQEAAAAREAVAGVRGRLDGARALQNKVSELAEDARHLARTAELMGAFRNSVVASIGPRLSAQAADLFAELTDHEYDRLEVDPDSYELQIRDHGVVYGMDRFSGSETDLANLALRVAISEQVRFQSGGAVGLLVLDEVFGPLDEDRRERMLCALDRLRARFRQVLVVTHDSHIKEQLTSAVGVEKLQGRRARARLL